MVSLSDRTCDKLNIKLSPIKQLLYDIIQKSTQPHSAYKLLDKIKEVIPNVKPMMIYRALSFLEEHGLIHKIKSTSTYHSCHYVIHQGAVFFLICQKCGLVDELKIKEPLVKALNKMASSVGFAFDNQICEISGLCQQCQSV